MILFYLILTTCGVHGCTSSNVHSYLTHEDCIVVAHAIERADDTIKTQCVARRVED